MSLAGRGAVTIWHDIAPEGRADFLAWHGSEHMPERLGIPGFLRGRRYVALQGRPEYFNLYETSATSVLTGADYLARLNNPTPWTRRAIGYFRGIARSLCEVEATLGQGQGGLCATFRYAIDERQAGAHRAAMLGAVRDLAALPGVAGAHFMVADEAASKIETEEKRGRKEPTAIPRWVVMVEGWDDIDGFAATTEAFARSPAFAAASGTPDYAIYRLQNSLDGTATPPR